MEILLDECVPRGLRRHLPGHIVVTVPELGWSGKKNGELMKLIAARSFDVFVTVDQGVSFQQNLTGSTFSIIVLSAASNRMTDLLPLMPRVVASLSNIQPGSLIDITA